MQKAFNEYGFDEPQKYFEKFSNFSVDGKYYSDDSLKNKITVIKAGKLIDTENGKVLNDQIIIIYNDTIKAVGSSLEIPKDAKIIDLIKKH